VSSGCVAEGIPSRGGERARVDDPTVRFSACAADSVPVGTAGRAKLDDPTAASPAGVVD
jgi:hypothetical protein